VLVTASPSHALLVVRLVVVFSAACFPTPARRPTDEAASRYCTATQRSQLLASLLGARREEARGPQSADKTSRSTSVGFLRAECAPAQNLAASLNLFIVRRSQSSRVYLARRATTKKRGTISKSDRRAHSRRRASKLLARYCF